MCKARKSKWLRLGLQPSLAVILIKLMTSMSTSAWVSMNFGLVKPITFALVGINSIGPTNRIRLEMGHDLI